MVCGSESLVRYATDRIYLIRTLKEFVHYDEFGREQGAGVRQKSEDLFNLLSNLGTLAEARRNKTLPGWSRTQLQLGAPNGAQYPGNVPAIEAPPEAEDSELQRAIEESKRTAALDEERRKQRRSEEGFFNNLASPKSQPMNHNGRKGGVTTVECITEYRALPYEQPRTITYQSPQEQVKPIQQPRSYSYELPCEERKAIAPPPKENPFLNKPLPLMLTEANPFENEIEASPNTDPFHEIPQQAPLEQYNIPIPQQRTRSHTVGDMAMGAKPVMPANMTPQFSANRKEPKRDPSYRPG